MILACKMLGLDPASVLFVGDDLRDIESGRDAGTRTAAVTYGYIHPDDNPATGARMWWWIIRWNCARCWITRCAVADGSKISTTLRSMWELACLR